MVEPGDRAEDFLSSLDVVALPSRYEGCPLTLLEAMALGRAVVASDIPGMQEVIGPSGAGLLVSPNDPVDLARGVVELVQDEDRRRELGTRAHAVATTDYRLKQMTERIVEILERAGQHV